MIAMLPKTDTVLPPDSARGLFSVAFNNAKKRGLGKQVIHCEAEGTRYSSGHVHLDTIEVQVQDFLSLQQMIDYLETFGTCDLVWLEQP